MRSEIIAVEGQAEELYMEWLANHPHVTESESDAFIAGMAFMKDALESKGK